MVVGSIIGLIIGFAVLFLALGHINTFVAELVWEMSLENELKTMFLHGLVLFIYLLLINIPWVIISYLIPHWVVTVTLFVIYVPIHGYIGVNVAEGYEAAHKEPIDYCPSEDL